MKRVSIGILSIVAIMGGLVWRSSLSHAATHPGLLNNRMEYDLMKTKVAAQAEPWYSAYKQVPDYQSYTPQPIADFYASYSGRNDGPILAGDADAAYASALHWIITRNTQHAEKAKQIVNAWSYKLRSVNGDAQKRLEISWRWIRFMYAAEILKHTYSNWSAADQQKFASLLRTLIVPNLAPTNISGGSSNRNNWAAFGARTRIAIGIYLDDAALFTKGVSDTKALINFYIGKFGHSVPSGFTYETCRQGNGSMGTLIGGDIHHTQYGLGAFVEAAEMAKKQGVNLYAHTDPSDNASVLTALLYHAPFIGYPNRGSAATWPCETALGSINTKGHYMPWHMAYNHYGHQALKAVSDYVGPTRDGGITGARYSRLTHNYRGATSSPAPSVAISPPVNVRVVSGQ
jgi:hypothetical protein